MNGKTKKLLEYSYPHIIVKFCLIIISATYSFIGIQRLILGAHEFPQSLDSILRFYAGGFTAIGFLAIWAIFVNKTQGIIVTFFAFFVFMTGIGRLVSIINVGFPNNTYLFYLVIELLLPLLMMIVQFKLIKE